MREQNELLKIDKLYNEYLMNKSSKSFDELFNKIYYSDDYDVEYNLINDKGTLHYSFSLWNQDELVKTYEAQMELV